MNSRQLKILMSVQTTEPQTQPVFSPVPAEETVSVVIPCYNEERFIGKALAQLADQFEADRYEIIVVDGLSTDRTRDVIDEFRTRRQDLVVTVIDNPARNIPTALNLGIAAARGDIIARMDAHAVPCDGYVRRCVEVLRSGTGAVVGMPCLVKAGTDTVVAEAIAAAVSHPFGIGDAKYRLGAGGASQEAVDTVAFACFRKSLWKALGGFNEALHANEDYDFNYRVRQAGFQVILDRAGHCDYFARTTLKALASQYLRYGAWKAEMIRLQPRSIKLRHMVAPGFVLSLLVLAVLSVIWAPARWILLLELAVYFMAAVAASLHATKGIASNKLGLILLLPLVFLTIHLAWGTSFLVGLSRVGKNTKDELRASPKRLGEKD